MRTAAAVLLAASAALAEPVDVDFETKGSAVSWTAENGEAMLVSAPVHGGFGALRFRAAQESAKLVWTGAAGDLSKCRAVKFFAWLEGDVERDVVLKVRTAGGDFWRKFSLRPQVWSEIAVPLWQFREEAAPRWEQAQALEFSFRRPATLILDDLSLPAGDAQVEPAPDLSARVFPEGSPVSSATSDNFRVFTDAPVDPGAVTKRLEEGLVRFRKAFGVEEALGRPVTLVIRKTADDYRQTAVDTAKDVYGGDMGPPQAGGFTFYAYSFTSFDEKQGALRPVFLHEACHQLVSRLLRFRGVNGAMWVEEGICYFLQNEFTPIENVKDEALKMLDNPKRPALASLDARQRIDSGGENLTAFLVIQYIMRGPGAEKFKPFAEALHANEVSLLKSVKAAFGVEPADFEKDYEAWTRKWASEK